MAFKFLLIIFVTLYLKSVGAQFGYSPLLQTSSKSSSVIPDRCFCELKGNVDECECSVDFVDTFNNNRIYPRLKSLLEKKYFRFFKVNLKKPCPFWPDDGGCATRACAVESCTEENIPAEIWQDDKNKTRYGPANNPKLLDTSTTAETCSEDSHQELGYLNTTLTKEMSADLALWKIHDENQNSFCDIDDDQNLDSVFVDLLLNPERYTGPKRGYGPYIDSTNVGDLCLEKRAFYRAISGLHTSINIHLCAQYLHGQGVSSRWGTNLQEFQARFDPDLTQGEGPKRLRNLYFVYLLELRAIAKAAPYLEQIFFYTGNQSEDAEVNAAVHDLLHQVKAFKPHFNESSMFTGGNKQAKKLKEEFRHHFRNITRIMDCVGCEKCKLWGKLQTQGLGTALKILFSGSFERDGDPQAFDLKSMRRSRFQLTRAEIVALFNAFGRLSNSIYNLENFRQSVNG
nr:EOG090X03A4 [Eurycercus lamellatus]